MERILLADDEPNVRLFYSDVLTDHGYDVFQAESSNEVLELIECQPPDLVVLDIKLGTANGLEVLQRIVRDHSDLPVILLSAYASFQDDYTSWLAESYILKSSDPGEFLQEVDRVLNRTGNPSGPEQINQVVSQCEVTNDC